MQDQPEANSATDKGIEQSNRSGFRFSLKSLLLLITLVAIGVGVLHQKWFVAWQAQKEAVRQIRAAEDGQRGSFHYEPVDDLPWWKLKIGDWLGKDAVTRVVKLYAEGTGELMDISAWTGMPSVESVGFDRAIVEDLSALGSLRNLKTVYIFQAGARQRPGQVGLEVLGKLTRLESVEIISTQFSFNNEIFDSICDATSITKFSFDAYWIDDLSPLAKLENLKELRMTVFRGGELKDLSAIGKLTKLKTLDLYLSEERQFDFSFLSGMEQLETLVVSGRLTEDRKARIKAAVPDGCELTWFRP